MKLLCLFFSLFIGTYINIQAQNSTVVQSTVENVLLGRVSAIQSSLANNFELDLRVELSQPANGEIQQLQSFFNEFPCKSLQITNNGGNPARGDYRANNGSFWLILHVNAANKLSKIVITPK